MFEKAIIKLTKRLYPKGRAFRIPFGGTMEKVHKALAVSENKAYSDARAVLDSILPDNDNFTSEDATDWERRLGLITNTSIPLVDRKAAISRKINHPGTIKARQHFLYLERELRAANFDVFVFENKEIILPTELSQMGFSESGVSEMGGETGNETEVVINPNLLTGPFSVVANHIDPELDEDFISVSGIEQMGEGEMGITEMGINFDLDPILRSTFFVGGPTLGSFAEIPGNRLFEFRQLILKVKPVQTIALLFLTFAGPDYNLDYNNDFNNP